MILELIKKRRSIRKFKSDLPPKEILEELIEAAIAAPSAGNMQPWRFVIVQKREVIQCAAHIVNEDRQRSIKMIRGKIRAGFEFYSKTFLAVADAPVLIIPVYRDIDPHRGYLEESVSEPDRAMFTALNRHSTVMSVACAVQNLLLMAEERELGACCMTGPLISGNRLNECFNIPESWHIAAVIAVGYPDETPGHIERKPVNKVTSWIV